jgi:hypothetical protein
MVKSNSKKVIKGGVLPPGIPGVPGVVNNVVKPKKIKGIFGIFHYLHQHISYLNSSKFFAGIIMIMLNVGSKFISIQFSKSTEEYLKYSVTKQLLVFAMAWMGTRCIYTAILLTAAFVVLSDHLFNEESRFCIVPNQYRVLHKLIDTNNDGKISDQELNNAITILTKAQKELKEKNTTTTNGNSNTTQGTIPLK